MRHMGLLVTLQDGRGAASLLMDALGHTLKDVAREHMRNTVSRPLQESIQV